MKTSMVNVVVYVGVGLMVWFLSKYFSSLPDFYQLVGTFVLWSSIFYGAIFYSNKFISRLGMGSTVLMLAIASRSSRWYLVFILINAAFLIVAFSAAAALAYGFVNSIVASAVFCGVCYFVFWGPLSERFMLLPWMRVAQEISDDVEKNEAAKRIALGDERKVR